MKKKDPNYAVKVEQAIVKKYGEETVRHPKNKWTDEKEREYVKQLKDLYKSKGEEEQEHVEVNGVFVSNKLFTKETKRSCPVCNTYSFKSNDDVYMSKFDACEKCYIRWIEDREERWLSGWRPNNENNQTKT